MKKQGVTNGGGGNLEVGISSQMLIFQKKTYLDNGKKRN
jgi:hypothetical protein